jgi:hypothetical protein
VQGVFGCFILLQFLDRFRCDVNLKINLFWRAFVICQLRLFGKEFLGVKWAAFVTALEMVVGFCECLYV